MTEIDLSHDLPSVLRGKTIVLTGGAQGIGATAVELFRSAGANVIFGDCAAEAGHQLEESLAKTKTSEDGHICFQHLDVRDYASQLALFDLAYAKYGRVDVAVSCAAVGEPGGFFEPKDLNMQTEPIALKNTIDINLTSVLSFCRIALAFMRDTSNSSDASRTAGSDESTEDNFSKSVVLVSSIAGITEAPGLFTYSSAKHGVIGLMRALRRWTPARYHVRVNAVCPWATDTQLFSGVKKRWTEEQMPLNQPEDVARFIVQCAADSSLNGKSIYVSGGRGFDTEEGYDRTLPQWLGEDNARIWLKGQDILGLGDDWTE